MDETAIIEQQRAADAFIEVAYADPEWVDAEFESIIADFWEAPTTTSTPPEPVRGDWPAGGIRMSVGDLRPAAPVIEVAAMIRSPPAWGRVGALPVAPRAV